MHRFNVKIEKFFYLLILGVICFQYFRIASQTGFLFDDWGSLYTSSQGYVKAVSNWWDIWLIRPFALMVLPLIISILGSKNALFYFILLFCLNIICLRLFWITLQEVLTKRQIILFTVLASTPFIASTSILSPVNQLQTSFSLLFLLLFTFYSVKNFSSMKVKRVLLISLLCISLFFYEVTLPLIIIPLYLAYIRGKKSFLFLLNSILFAISFVIFWQKIISPVLVSVDYSRLQVLDLSSAASYCYQIFVGIPIRMFVGVTYSKIHIFSFILFSSLLFLLFLS